MKSFWDLSENCVLILRYFEFFFFFFHVSYVVAKITQYLRTVSFNLFGFFRWKVARITGYLFGGGHSFSFLNLSIHRKCTIFYLSLHSV